MTHQTTAEPRTAATGAHTTNGVPHGWTSLTPHIVVSPARAALEFYRDVFGASVSAATEMQGLLAHADLDLGSGHLTISDPLYGLSAPDPEGASYSLALYVPDVDGIVDRAVQAGATLREQVATFVSGDRYGSILDPFGVRWTIMTRVEDIPPAESVRRVEEWAAAQSGPADA